MKYPGLGQALNPMTSVLRRKGRREGIPKRSHMKTEAETGVTQPPAQDSAGARGCEKQERRPAST